MTITSVNHINITVDDVQKAAPFYEDIFELERIPSIDSPNPGVWFQMGDVQLHLTQRDDDIPEGQHFAVNVDNFVECYDRLTERGSLDWETFGSALYILPDATMQMYARDPCGNRIEIDWPDYSTLPDRISDRATTRADLYDIEETAEGKAATLFSES